MIALFPIVWMAITAFKDERELYQMQFPLCFHLPPTLKHVRLLFTQTWFGTWVANTALVSLWVVWVTLFWGALMAAGLFVGLPAALAFNLVIDRFIQGLSGAGDR